MLQIPKLAGRL